MDGRYPALCQKQLLTDDHARQVAAAEAKARASRPAPTPGAIPDATGGCASGHWIEAVEGDGKVIKLEDGSIWEVDDIDTVTTSIWLPISEVVLCAGKMINIDDGESVQVSPIGGARGRTGGGTRGYVIEAAANDETFAINGDVFKAKTYCFGFDRGDRVEFVSGSALGACASATPAGRLAKCGANERPNP